MRVDPEDLAVVALRRDTHLTDGLADPFDRAELDALRRTVTVGRSVTPDDASTDDPPADLWSRIAGEAFAGPAGGFGSSHDDSGDDSGVGPAVAGGGVVDLAERRARRRTVLGAVAAAMVVIAGVGALVWSQKSTPTNELVASTDLSLLGAGGKGTAELVKEGDGLHLRVDVSGLEPAQQADHFELWLATADLTDMKSMTTFDKATGTIDVLIPEGMDPGKFPVVDISAELDDSNPAHSADSILRGSLA